MQKGEFWAEAGVGGGGDEFVWVCETSLDSHFGVAYWGNMINFG